MAQQYVTHTHSLAIERLKGIRQLEEISFDEHPITGIFGPNGVGKSTVLHALACAYKQPSGAEADSHYRDFFPKLEKEVWDGTKFTIKHSGKIGTSGGPRVPFEKGEFDYQKGAATTNWKPTPNSRPERHIVYLGVRSCDPEIESGKPPNLTGARYESSTEAKKAEILAAASDILNARYTDLQIVTPVSSPNKQLIALERTDRTTDDGRSPLVYPSLTMGAGEQRVVKLLRALYGTRKGGLLLIDEIDLLLHEDALRNLIKHFARHCEEKEKQVIFTTHREVLLSMDEYINVRHLHREDEEHLCFSETNPDCLRRLTGVQERSLEIFVEDSLAEAIVYEVAGDLGISKHLRVRRFGSAENSFTLLSALLLRGESCSNALFLLDGDVFLDSEERRKQCERKCSGDDPRFAALAQQMPDLIKDLQLPVDQKPEPFLHSLVVGQDAGELNHQETEIFEIAREIVATGDSHDFIRKVSEVLGGDHTQRESQIVQLAAKAEAWAEYTAPVREWLEEKSLSLGLRQATPAAGSDAPVSL